MAIRPYMVGRTTPNPKDPKGLMSVPSQKQFGKPFFNRYNNP
jgi:hypothetical protein